MALKLWDLSSAYLEIQRLLDEGQDFSQALSDIDEEIDLKIENVARMSEEFKAESRVFQDEAKRFSEKAQATLNKAESLREYLRFQMELVGKDKVKGELLTVSLQKSPPSCVIIDETLIPLSFIRIIPEHREPDKKAILDSFRATGEQIAGVEIQSKRHLVIR